ncbi:MAG: cupin domain-containing protein [Chitinophagaceae bacterium]
MSQSNLFQIESEIPWQDLGAGVQRQLFGYDDKIMLVKVKFETGSIGQLHKHTHSQASFVESGVFELTIGEEKKTLKAGDGYYAPPHVVHGALCLEAGVLIDTFSPKRDDFMTLTFEVSQTSKV